MTEAALAALIGKLIFWIITSLIVLLCVIVGKLYWSNRQLRKGAIDTAVNGIQAAVEELAKSMKEMAKEYSRSFAKGEKRFDDHDHRLTTVETQCKERHHPTG